MGLTEVGEFALDGVVGLGVDAWRPALYIGSAEGGCELDMISWPPDVVQMSWRRQLPGGSAADKPSCDRLECLSVCEAQS